jgi:hypothetical protein
MKYMAYYLIIGICWVGYSLLLFEKVAPEIHPTEVVVGAILALVIATAIVWVVILCVLCVLLPIYYAPKIYRRLGWNKKKLGPC